MFKKNYKYFSFCPAIGMMILIFLFSAKPATQSSQMSEAVVEQLLLTAEKFSDANWTNKEFLMWVNRMHTPIRKLAHMAEYAVLALTVAFPLYLVWRLAGKQLLFICESICVLYAASDELHQWFVPGRSCELRDIIIDSAGAFLGCCIAVIFILWQQKRKYTKKALIR